MQDDNAWPDTAPIETFIEERQRPPRVRVAGLALLVGAGLALLAGLLHLAVSGTAGAGFLIDIPGMVMLVLNAVIAAYLAFIARGVIKGWKWVLRVARGTAAAAAIFYLIYGLLAKPGDTVHSGALLLWLDALLAFAAVAAGLVALVCLFGASVTAFFAPPQAVKPSEQQHNGQASMGGNDADWTPPAQRDHPPQWGRPDN
ncbi:MAG TPA: hypothetical protein VE172_18360 [Stackebrandtia sp.]|jgi:hypothetical protein|uniref:hypothetical protein n=1 Tax=Stackebrandtia sp. TaxID=2023065 RepID=UPI002D60484F|nr:hypothetical protein [Stackebrandtia sp.]HZE40769.1 hypothetical protein [Stackebrandtia sp.]